jgi:hypothetical protein
MANKLLIQNVFQNESAEVGFDTDQGICATVLAACA